MQTRLLPARLRAAREGANLNQQQVAERLGIKASAVSQWEGGETRPAQKRLPLLANIYGVNINYFFEDIPSEVTPAFPVELPAAGQWPRDVPIYGVTAAGHEDDDSFNVDSEIVDYGRRPPALSSARDLYGLYIASDSMEPAYQRGDLVYVRRRTPPRPGDDVIIQLLPRSPGDQPPSLIKRLVRRTADRLIVEQHNPPRQIELPVERIIAVHRVIRLGDALGT